MRPTALVESGWRRSWQSEALPQLPSGVTGSLACVAVSRLLDDSVRIDVRPDSVRVLGGMLSSRLPTSFSGVALFRFAFPSGAVPGRG